MTQQPPRPGKSASLFCRIRANGRISDSAISCWTSLRIDTLPSTSSRLESEVHGYLPDQSALIGVINHLYNLGYAISFVECASVGYSASSGAT